MEPQIRTLVDISGSRAALQGRADMTLERAQWASEIIQRYDRETTMEIVDAVARRGHENAQKYADRAVEETGFGVAAHKKLKKELTTLSLVDFYRQDDFASPRIDADRRIVEIPRPAGVIFALTPSTNPISTLNYKILLALMTRNAISHQSPPGGAGLLCRCRGGTRRGRDRRRRPGRGHPDHRRAVDPADRGIHGVPQDLRHPGDGRQRHGPRRLFLIQSRNRCRARQCTGLCRQQRRRQSCCPAHRGRQEL